VDAIQTMKGAISFDKLGRCLIHEHIISGDIEHALNYCPDFDEEAEVARAAGKLNAVKASGMDSLIDLTVLGIGRYVPRIAKVAARTELNIIVATGCFAFNDMPGPFRLAPDPIEHMAELFTRDIVEGIVGTTVKAGVLKCAIDKPGLTDGVEKVMRAVARAHLRTGAPITVHTDAETKTGRDAQRVLADEGVDLRDVIIGHCGDSTDLDYLCELADRGSILGMDRFGMTHRSSLDRQVHLVGEMIKRGYIGSLGLSHDCFCWTNAFIGRRSPYPQHDYLTVPHTVVPALIAAGHTQEQIDTLLVENPRRHFEGAAQRFAAQRKPAFA
jgi:phosphotriesterase-related protein